MIIKNSIGGNVGNLIYAYSIYRALMVDNTKIVPDYYRINSKDADKINENFDCYVIPLADAFRKEFIPHLRKYTDLIKKLKIPVVVIGVGLRAPFEPKLDEGFPFDQDVKEFVKAVLAKSSIVGVRGEITATYLNRLGFREGIDHTVIGCPSMYTFGKEIRIRETTITKDSLVCFNSSLLSPENVLNFINRSMEDYPNHYFIPQWLKEMRLVYLGSPSLDKHVNNYPAAMTHSVYANDRVRIFLNAPTWIEFMRQADLSFGARLHGNITATISGTPSLIIPKDARMRELAEYHKLTSFWWNNITENTKLEDIIEKSDFKSPEKAHSKNFDNYINFLNINHLSHIYHEKHVGIPAPLDQQMSQVKLQPPLSSITGCRLPEVISRWENFQQLSEQENKQKEKKMKDLLRKNEKSTKIIMKEEAEKRYTIEKKFLKREKRLKKELITKDKTIKHLRGTLNRKSVRMTLATADKLRFK